MIITTTCPHCSAERIALNVYAAAPARNPLHAQLFAACPTCDAASVIIVYGGFESFFAETCRNLSKPVDVLNGLLNPGARVVNTFPRIKRRAANPTWPEPIQKPFVDAQNMLASGMSEALVISACRSVLDVVLKDLNAKGRNIFERIDDLAEKGVITGILKDWAHRLRDKGNDAVHDLDSGPPGQAEQLVRFTKLLLHIAYELPAEIPADPAVSEKGDAG